MANLYDMYYAQAMNHYLADRNSPDANEWAQQVKRCFKRDSLLCLYYNKVISGGKWDGMMTQKHIGYRSWNDNFPHDMLPEVKTVDEKQKTDDERQTTEDGGYIFSPTYSLTSHPSSLSSHPGYISMEAEHFYAAKADGETQWSVYPYYGRTRSAVALTPYTKPVGNASLTYRFTLPEDAPKTVKVHVIVKSTLDFLNVGGYEYTVSIDGSEPQTVNFNKTLVDRQPYMYSEFYPTIARRVVEKVVEVPVGKSQKSDIEGQKSGVEGQKSGVEGHKSDVEGLVHELTLQPKHPGIVFEKIVVDFGGYRPSYLYMPESDYKRK
jgi:hypothetical protein